MKEIAKLVREYTNACELQNHRHQCCTENNKKIGAHVISRGNSTRNNYNNNKVGL